MKRRGCRRERQQDPLLCGARDKTHARPSIHPVQEADAIDPPELYLRLYCGFQQDDWQNLLAMAEFAYNNSYHSSTGMSPFYCNAGRHPRMAITVRDSNVPDARAYAARLEEVHTKAREMLR
jgi:hypothetical protein